MVITEVMTYLSCRCLTDGGISNLADPNASNISLPLPPTTVLSIHAVDASAVVTLLTTAKQSNPKQF